MKVTCIGEMLIDFVCTDTDAGLVNGVNYVKKSGGAPANVAACVAKLGGQAELVASVGDDPFGEFLVQEINTYGVNTQQVNRLNMSTTFAYVSLSENGDREFAFSRGADAHLSLSADEIDSLTNNAILHLGSATALLGSELGDSYYLIANAAKEKGNIVCFDPNYRIDLWPNREKEFKAMCEKYFSLANMVKVSDEELVLLSGNEDLYGACHYIHNFGVKLVLVTLGSKGCLVSYGDTQVIVPAYKIDVVDTTGAGDSFIGAILFKLAEQGYSENFYRDDMEEFVAFAGKVSGLVCSTIGAMSALPSLQEVESTPFQFNA